MQVTKEFYLLLTLLKSQAGFHKEVTSTARVIGTATEALKVIPKSVRHGTSAVVARCVNDLP